MESETEAVKHLDLVTGLNTPLSMDVEVACARWHGMMERMYAINGDLEF